MPKDTADIYGKTGTPFVAVISSGQITKALLEVVGQPIIKLSVDDTGRQITVPGLPSGDSEIGLAIRWMPAEANATIGVASGAVTAAAEPGVLYDNDPTGAILLFGED